MYDNVRDLVLAETRAGMAYRVALFRQAPVLPSSLVLYLENPAASLYVPKPHTATISNCSVWPVTFQAYKDPDASLLAGLGLLYLPGSAAKSGETVTAGNTSALGYVSTLNSVSPVACPFVAQTVLKTGLSPAVGGTKTRDKGVPAQSEGVSDLGLSFWKPGYRVALVFNLPLLTVTNAADLTYELLLTCGPLSG